MASEGARQNFHKETEAGVNKQINHELYSSYFYQALAFHFDRDDIALQGFHNYFKKLSDVEREDAETLMTYQNKRGGRIILQDVKKPSPDVFPSTLEIMQAAHQVSKSSNQSLLDLHTIANKHNDSEFANFLEDKFLHKQAEIVKEMSDHISNLRRVGTGLGEYQFDKETMN